MRNRLVCLTLAATLAACSHPGNAGDPVAVDNFGSFNAATVEVTAEGGIAALSVLHVVRHDDRAFVFSQRHLCAQTCGAPLDSASGTLGASATDSLFNIVLAQAPFSLKDDYGTTPNAADMMSYTLRISADGNVKTIRADDGTMPAPMRQIVKTVREIVAAALK